MKFVRKNPNIKLWQAGLLQAAGIVLYIMLISFTMTWVSQHFRGGPATEFANGVVFLTIFCTSAFICGFITMAYPAYLALNNKVGDAIRTLAWMGLFLVLTVLIIGTTFVLSTPIRYIGL